MKRTVEYARDTIPAAPSTIVPAQDLVAEAPERTLWQDSWRRFRKHRLARVGLVLYLAVVVFVLVGPFLWRTSLSDIDFATSNVAVSAAHPFGTDDLGRDTLARILWGGRVSIAVGIASSETGALTSVSAPPVAVRGAT